LIPKFATALKEGKISKGVALEAARIPADQQGELASMILRKGESADAFSVTYVKEWIGRHHMRPLKHAPWSLGAEMYRAEKFHGGACVNCAKRTGAEPVLFAELKKTDDRCLDAGCWTKRTEQIIRIEKARVPELHSLKGHESPWKWKEKDGGTQRGIVIEDGYGEDGIVAGTMVEFDWVKGTIGDAARATAKSKAEAKKGRETIAIRSKILAATITSILLTGYAREDVQACIRTFVGRMVNDDRRFLCKALGLEVMTGKHGGKDFEATVMKWIEGIETEKGKGFTALNVFVSLAVACHAARFWVEGEDLLMEAAKHQKVDVKAIEASVREGKKKTPPAAKKAKAVTTPKSLKPKAKKTAARKDRRGKSVGKKK
jgi:hypothetical protein